MKNIKNKATVIKKGYIFIMFFALFVSITGTLKYRLYVKRDFDVVSLNDIILRVLIGFLIYLIPGLLLVHWYYRIKDKRKM
jgi:hypothetical protein